METYTAPFGEVLTAIATPFNASGEVDYGQFWKLCRHLVDNGNDGLVVTGTTGESPTLRIAEKIALYRTAIDAVGQKAHVIAGTGTYDTRESVELTRRATDLGCTGIMAVTPYYSKPPQEGLFRHFTAIANASTVPVLLYNIPGRTSRLIDNDTLERLSAHDSIVAVKDAVEDITFTNETVDRCGGDLVKQSRELHGSTLFLDFIPTNATDAYIEASGAPSVIPDIIGQAGPGARISVVALHREPRPVDFTMVLAKQLTIAGSMAYPDDYGEAVRILGEVDLSAMITHRFPLDRIEEALTVARDPNCAGKVIVEP